MLLGSGSRIAEDYSAIQASLDTLRRQSNATVALLIDTDGQLITNSGDSGDLDLFSFCSLTAADFAATNQLATLVGEEQFSTLYHRGVETSIYMMLVCEKVILVVLFGSGTTLGLVQVRAKQAAVELAQVFRRLFSEMRSESKGPHLDESFAKEIEGEIDKLLD
jgi:predicted regulator of Ras-like GTPase activity (Roadblock/LC7/MglB family)